MAGQAVVRHDPGLRTKSRRAIWCSIRATILKPAAPIPPVATARRDIPRSQDFVHNKDGSRSMLRNLTIEEYRAEQLRRAG